MKDKKKTNNQEKPLIYNLKIVLQSHLLDTYTTYAFPFPWQRMVPTMDGPHFKNQTT